MQLGTTYIEDTFAEAFRMQAARLIVTAADAFWLQAAISEATGNATSVIGCDTEAGLERVLSPEETLDGRPGAALLFFGMKPESLAVAVAARTGQSLLTCATTAVYDGLPDAQTRVPLGKQLRFFGDGFQKSKLVGGRRYWRIPVMDGEFIVEDTIGLAKGIAGGNMILQARDQATALAAVRRAIESVADLPNVVLPFPGGAVRSGSKVGSRYKKLIASTNDTYCPTLVGRVDTSLEDGATCAYEIVFDSLDEDSMITAMRAAIAAAAGDGVLAITAGNYGGKLGKFHFHLREIVGSS